MRALSARELRGAALPALAFAVLSALYLWTLGRPSLWLDEAWEANYYVGIAAAPWYNRPVLYMSAERLMVSLFGPSELVLRLLPCLAGLTAIAATFWLVHRTLGRACAWLSAGLLAVAPTFLYEAHQLKHYTFDALFTVLLVLAYLRYREDPSARRLAGFGLTALVSFGFSFASVFVLTAIVLVHAASWLRDRDAALRRQRLQFLAASALLFAAFAAVYAVFHAGAQGDTLLKDYFVEAWMPLSEPLTVPGWIARQSRVLGEIAGASSFAAFALLLAAGVRREWARPAPRLLTAVMGLSLLVLLGTSAAHLYPYGSARLTLFLAPLVCALAAAGILEVWGIPQETLAAAGRARWPGAQETAVPARATRWVRGAAVAGLLYVLFYPAISGARPYLWRGWGTDELARVIGALSRAHAPGEGIFVPERAMASFPYYWWRAGRGTDRPDVIWGERHRLHPEDHAAQVARIAKSCPSVWVIFDDQSREERETLRGLFLEHYVSIRREGERDAVSVELFRKREAAGT